LLICIRNNQTGIHRKSLAANQASPLQAPTTPLRRRCDDLQACLRARHRVGVKSGIIMDVEASRAIRQARQSDNCQNRQRTPVRAWPQSIVPLDRTAIRTSASPRWRPRTQRHRAERDCLLRTMPFHFKSSAIPPTSGSARIIQWPLGFQVPVAFLAIRGITKSPKALWGKNTHVERKIISSLTMQAILPRGIFLTLSLVLRLADAKKTAFGATGKTIKQDGSSSGMPHGYGARGDVSNGRSPIKIDGRDHRRSHHVIAPTTPIFEYQCSAPLRRLGGNSV